MNDAVKTKLTRTIGLEAGDVIISNNRPVEVVSVERAPSIGRRMMFRVTLSTGRTLTSAVDARWLKVV